MVALLHFGGWGKRHSQNTKGKKGFFHLVFIIHIVGVNPFIFCWVYPPHSRVITAPAGTSDLLQSDRLGAHTLFLGHNVNPLNLGIDYSQHRHIWVMPFKLLLGRTLNFPPICVFPSSRRCISPSRLSIHYLTQAKGLQRHKVSEPTHRCQETWNKVSEIGRDGKNEEKQHREA